VLERPHKAPSLEVALSSTTDLIECHVDAEVANGVHWGCRLPLTTVFSRFPELELELELLGSRYNVDLTKDVMEVFWTQTRWALESLLSRVPSSVARSLPNGAREE
jgi:hypothetical protein